MSSFALPEVPAAKILNSAALCGAFGRFPPSWPKPSYQIWPSLQAVRTSQSMESVNVDRIQVVLLGHCYRQVGFDSVSNG